MAPARTDQALLYTIALKLRSIMPQPGAADAARPSARRASRAAPRRPPPSTRPARPWANARRGSRGSTSSSRKTAAMPMTAAESAIAQPRASPRRCSQPDGMLMPTAIMAAAKPSSSVERAAQMAVISSRMRTTVRLRWINCPNDMVAPLKRLDRNPLDSYS